MFGFWITSVDSDLLCYIEYKQGSAYEGECSRLSVPFSIMCCCLPLLPDCSSVVDSTSVSRAWMTDAFFGGRGSHLSSAFQVSVSLRRFVTLYLSFPGDLPPPRFNTPVFCTRKAPMVGAERI